MPEALLMAGRLLEAERYTQGARVATQVDAAAELRRQHSVNAVLLSALQNIALYTSQTHPDKEVMAQVLDENARIARAAIKKAEEVKP
jgi:hypothetical protein